MVYRNHPSSTHKPQAITNYLLSEVDSGRIVGPLPPSIMLLVHVSPMGLVPKNHSDNGAPIVDLSSPHDQSVNDGISADLCSLRYTSVDNAVEIITSLGRSSLLAKFDLSNTYHILPVHPDDQPLLGVTWQANIYMDKSLPFGLRSALKVLMLWWTSWHGFSSAMVSSLFCII